MYGKKKIITVLFISCFFPLLATGMTHHWADVLVRPVDPVQASATKVKSATAVQNHHHLDLGISQLPQPDPVPPALHSQEPFLLGSRGWAIRPKASPAP